MTLGATKPTYFYLPLWTLFPLHTPQIENVGPTTELRLPDVSLRRSPPTPFPLPPVCLPPQASPMSRILATITRDLTKEPSVYTFHLPPHFRQKEPHIRPIQCNRLYHRPVENCRYPGFCPLLSKQCPQSTPDRSCAHDVLPHSLTIIISLV